MLEAASRCVRCGYEIRESETDDFPKRRRATARREDLAYTPFAQLSLEIWAYLALFSIVLSLVVSAVFMFRGEWLRVLLGLLGAWGNFALYALLRRVADVD